VFFATHRGAAAPTAGGAAFYPFTPRDAFVKGLERLAEKLEL
jgi:hypothetical protein